MRIPAQASSPRRLWRQVGAHPFAAVFVLALAVRLVNVALLRGNEAFFADLDTVWYWAVGRALASPEGFWPTLASITARMPLYPLLLAGIHSVFGDMPRAVALVQAAIDAGSCTLIAALGALVAPSVGLAAGVLAAFSPTLIVSSSQILTDTLFLFFFTAMLVAGAHLILRPSKGSAILAGLMGGLALATRPTIAALLAIAVPIVFAVAIVHRRGAGPALAAAMLFAVAAAAPVAPLILRNVSDYRSFSLTSQTGDHLAYWIVPLVQQRADGTAYQTTVERMEARYRQRLAQRGSSGETNPFRQAELKSELAREEMARLPLAAYAKAWLEGMAVNLAAPALAADPRVRALPRPSFYHTPGASLWEKARAYLFADSGRYQLILLVGLLATLPFLALDVIGFVMLARTLPWAAVLAGGVLAYFLLLNGPVAGAKYRLPMEPVLIVLAAMPVAWFVRRMNRRAT